ncbi:hypothetical protein RXP12_29000, partial [Pseudomonas aeruginosa]|nr:hypothetical protein [Pseudomonas aeruginosa]
AHNPDLYDKMLGMFSYGEDREISNPIDASYGKVANRVERSVRLLEKYIHHATTLNRMQEKHFRFATFKTTLYADLKGMGVDLDKLLETGDTSGIPRPLLERAVKRALEDTFGEQLPSKGVTGQLATAANNFLRYIPFPVSPILFRR